MPASTVILGIGRLGRDVIARLANFLDPSESVRCIECSAREAGPRVEAVLEDLLRAGKTQGSSPRLDLFAFVDVLEGSEGDMVELCSQTAQVVGGKYAVLFPSNLPPEQRNAALHIIAVMPALAPGPSAEAALARLARVDRWAATNQGHPLLSRVWLVSRHTTAGTLSDESLLISCASFASAFVVLRDEDPVTQRLGHLSPEDGKFAFLSAASLDLRESRIRKYAALRTGYDGLRTLVERVTRPVSDPSLGAQAVSSLSPARWLAPFDDGAPADDCRKLGMSFSGMSIPDLPVRIEVRPFDDDASIRSRYGILFRSASEERPRTGVDTAQLDQALRSVDRAEAEATVELSRAVANLVETEVGRTTGLRRLPEVELGLKQIAASLRDQQLAASSSSGIVRVDPQAAAPGAEPFLAEVEASLEDLPSKRGLRGWTAAVALGVATIGLVAGMRITVTPPSVSANQPNFSTPAFASASGFAAAPAGPSMLQEQAISWSVALVAGLVAAGVAMGLVTGRARKRVQEQLERRRDALMDAASGRTGGSTTKQQAEAQLQLRKRRLRLAALSATDHALSHLAVARATLLDAHARQLQELRDIGIKSPAANASGDNLGPILGATDVLHDVLLPDLSLLSDWVARRRRITDNELWADRLVEETWSERGIAEDVPCADPGRMDKLCSWQVDPLEEVSVLGDAQMLEAASVKLRGFVGQVAEALAPICQPRDLHGDPARGIRLASLFAVAPQIARGSFDAVFRSSERNISVLWTRSQAARVLLIRTWEGYRLDDIARGSGIRPPERATDTARGAS
ncbi:MAG: hypothetical protein HY898_07345 [Deltaproteobacteria bacterium]|nr:hypothetical protein [Deltaproteobacteria bacterium]